tara:strand:- start:444 stop:743 length:300 start_codon:yes stop_codon:yes gene_type:complete
MKINRIISSTLILIAISCCGVPQTEYDKLNTEKKEIKIDNKRLINELDECINGTEKLSIKIEPADRAKEYSIAKQVIIKSIPNQKKNKDFRNGFITSTN